MRSSLSLSLLSVATIVVAAEWSFVDFELHGLTKRQTDVITIPGLCAGGNTCQEACGPSRGGTWDLCTANNSNTCFNAEQICCADGSICPVGTYCAGGGNCCNEGDVPSNCRGYTSLATVVGAEATSSTPPQSSYVDGETSTTETSTTPILSAYTPTSATSPPAYTSSSTTNSHGTESDHGAETSTHPHPAQPTANLTTPGWYPPPQQTGSASMRGEASGWLFGGLAFLGLGFFL